MKMIFKAFAKKLFGARYERLTRAVSTCLIVFWGLYIAGLRVEIAPFILYLMVSTFTAGMMWQALCSEDNAADIRHILMLPTDHWEFLVSYVAVLGVYTLFTKTAALLSVLLAVSVWGPAELLGSILCAVIAVLMAAAVYSVKRTDGYSFYPQEGASIPAVKRHTQGSVWRYLFRYLVCHRNYMINTVVMWCAACVLPVFFRQTGLLSSLSVVPIGLAVLTLNTPVCILLSCDRALEQAIRYLPGQRKAFGIPYCLFIFLCNVTADAIFLISLQIQNGGVTVLMLAEALFFALQSAICSVLLEWFCPVRGWKIESDLWHHPRKYIVPAAMLLLAGAVGTLPALMPVLMILLFAEIIILLLWCCGCPPLSQD